MLIMQTKQNHANLLTRYNMQCYPVHIYWDASPAITQATDIASHCSSCLPGFDSGCCCWAYYQPGHGYSSRNAGLFSDLLSLRVSHIQAAKLTFSASKALISRTLTASGWSRSLWKRSSSHLQRGMRASVWEKGGAPILLWTNACKKMWDIQSLLFLGKRLK